MHGRRLHHPQGRNGCEPAEEASSRLTAAGLFAASPTHGPMPGLSHLPGSTHVVGGRSPRPTRHPARGPLGAPAPRGPRAGCRVGRGERPPAHVGRPRGVTLAFDMRGLRGECCRPRSGASCLLPAGSHPLRALGGGLTDGRASVNRQFFLCGRGREAALPLGRLQTSTARRDGRTCALRSQVAAARRSSTRQRGSAASA